MKKFAITLCILGGVGLTSGAFAALEEENMATVPFIKNDGYSTEMTKITDYVRYQHSNGKVTPYYSLDPYVNCDTNKLKWYTAIKRWFDPAQDDELFGRHEITFSNGWFENQPAFYGSKQTYAKEKNVESVAADEVVEDVQQEIQQVDTEIENAVDDYGNL